MANGNCKHGTPLLLVCPQCDGVEEAPTPTTFVEAGITLAQRIRAALILEIRYQLATRQIERGPDAGMWECGQITRREGERVWIDDRTRARATFPYEAVEHAAMKAQALADKAARKQEKKESEAQP